MGQFMELCNQIAVQAECAVLVIAHVGKASGSRDESSASDVRGGSAIVDESRCAWVFRPESDGKIRLTNVKQTYGSRHDDLFVEFTHPCALRECGGRDLGEVVKTVNQWLSANPSKNVTQYKIKTDNYEGKELRVAVGAKLRWASPEIISEAVAHGLTDGRLQEVEYRNNGQTKKRIQPGSEIHVPSQGPKNTPDQCPAELDDIPF